MTLYLVSTLVDAEGREVRALIPNDPMGGEPTRYLGVGQVNLPDGRSHAITFPIDGATSAEDAFQRLQGALEAAGREFARQAIEEQRRIVVPGQIPPRPPIGRRLP